MLKKIIDFLKSLFSSNENKDQKDTKKKKPVKDNYPMW